VCRDAGGARPGDEQTGAVEVVGGLVVPSPRGVLPREQLEGRRGVGDVAQLDVAPLLGELHRLTGVGEGAGAARRGADGAGRAATRGGLARGRLV
jgi:hypothetical protein